MSEQPPLTPSPAPATPAPASPAPASLIAYLRSGEFWLTVGVGVASLSLLLALVLFVLLPVLTRHGASETVPDVSRLSLADATARLDDQGLAAAVIDSQFVPTLDPLTVITQTPARAEKVKPGRTIYLVVNKQRPPAVRLPELIDVNLQQGRYLLETWGLRVGRVSYVAGDAADLIRQVRHNGRTLRTGDAIPAGTQLELLVSRGPGTQTVELPDLVGLSLGDATSRLNNARLAVGVIRYGSSAEFRERGVVFRQVPPYREGAQVAEGYAVDLYVTGERADLDEVGKPGGE